MESSDAEKRRLFYNEENERLANDPEDFGEELDSDMRKNQTFTEMLAGIDWMLSTDTSTQSLTQLNGSHAGQSVTYNINNYNNSFNGGSNMPVSNFACQSPAQLHSATPSMPAMQFFGHQEMGPRPEGFMTPVQENMESLPKNEVEKEVKEEVMEQGKEEEAGELKDKIMESIEKDDDSESRDKDPKMNDSKIELKLPSRPRKVQKRKKAPINPAPSDYHPVNNHETHGQPQPRFDVPQMNNNGMQASPHFYPIHPDMQYQGVYGHPPPHPNVAGNFGAPMHPMYHPNGPETRGMVAPGYHYPPPHSVGTPGNMMGPPTHHLHYPANFVAVGPAPYPNGPGNPGMLGSYYPPPPPYQQNGRPNLMYDPALHPAGPGNPAPPSMGPGSPYINKNGQVMSGREDIRGPLM